MKRSYFKIGILAITGTMLYSCSSDDNVTPNQDPTHSPYIAKVYEFAPAVGQFINSTPVYTPADTKESMLAKVNKALVGSKTSMVSLGGFGGYIVFGFDHTVENKTGFMDFRIKGNAFKSGDNTNVNEGGSSEPGVILVSYDENNNGLPDDTWYEIAGSAYNASIKDYEITYYKPITDKAPVSGDLSWQKDIEYIKWTDNQGNSGYKTQNSFHNQSYFPEWITEDKITFKGTKLPNNAVNEGTDQEPFWIFRSLDWGYADNAPNNENQSAVDIDWAVDKEGNKVHLKGIDFVKVYTGINQEAGWLGEISTEITGAEDLHLLNKSIPTIQN